MLDARTLPLKHIEPGQADPCRAWLQFVGYSQDSRLPAEFDVTAVLRPGGDNVLAVQVGDTVPAFSVLSAGAVAAASLQAALLARLLSCTCRAISAVHACRGGP